MKQFNFILLLIIGSLLSMSSCSWQRIDAGHVGIKVNQYGSEKGVDQITEVTGMVWYNPFFYDVYEFPTYIQNAVYTADPTQGSKYNQEFKISTQDGLVAAFDISINYRVADENVVPIFEKYRKPLSELNQSIIYDCLKKAFNQAASSFTCEQLYQERERFQNKSDSLIRNILEPEGFTIEQVILLNELRLPPSIVAAIEAKAKAKEEASKKEEELFSSKADAEKLKMAAQGEADAMIIRALGIAKSNEIIARSITPQILDLERINKWNGVFPKTMTGKNTSTLLNID